MTVDQQTTGHPVGEYTGDDGRVADVDQVRLTLDAVRAGVLDLIERSGVHPTAVRLTVGDISIEMDWTHTAAPAAAPPASATVPTPDGTAAPADPAAAAVTAPAVGVFYRAPEPGATPFVEVGDAVTPGQKVGLIEAMKLMIPVEADRAGTVTDVVGVNGEPVEYGQPLIVIAPATGRE